MKSNAAAAAFKELKETQARHSKIQNIIYDEYKIQPYLTNPKIHTTDKHTLTAIRSQCARGVRMNFPKMYKYRLNCPLQCNNETPQPDSQRHILNCTRLNTNMSRNISIESVNGNAEEQELIGPILSRLLRQRTRLLDEIAETSLPGADLEHSTLHQGAAATRV